MDKKVNLDELFPGMEYLYDELYERYGDHYDRVRKVLKYIGIIFAIVFALIFFRGIR